MTKFQIGTPEYYRDLLTHPVVGYENGLRFDFNFINPDGGTMTMTDTTNGRVYNARFGLVYEDEECILGIDAIDFYIHQSNGSLANWKDKFDTQMKLLTTGLKGFGRDVGANK